jgi:phosphoribosyl 1,2-cyclic phosphodiesterase
MKLTFLGTCGNTKPRNECHRRHSALLVSYYHVRIMVDCGDDWHEKVEDVKPGAIVLTHAHPDHAAGLRDGAPCPVYATEATWSSLANYPLEKGGVIVPREPLTISSIVFEAFSVEHSTRAPAVGYRISAGRVTLFYVPDVVYIQERDAALRNARLYVGDGATMTRSMVRKIDGALVGHTPIRTQLTWCQKEGVPWAIFTHCGARIIKRDRDNVGAELNGLAAERNVSAEIACDGKEVVLR